MRRIALVLSAVVTLALTQGCGTTHRNKAVVTKPGETGSAVQIAPTSASSKGGTTAKPGTVTVDLYGKQRTAQAAPTPAPAPVKSEPTPVTVVQPKPVVKEAPKPVTPAKVEKVAPPKVEKPTPAPKQEVAKAEPEPAKEISISPYSSKGGSAAEPGTVTVDLYKGASTTATPTKAPAAPKKEKPAPKPRKEVTTAKPAPLPAATTEKPVAKTEPAPKAEETITSTKSGAKVGIVSQVNNEYKFIVIEFDDESRKLVAGSIVQITRGGKVVATAKLEEPLDHWPLATATVIEGAPEKQDVVAQ